MRPLRFVAACTYLNAMLWALLSQVITVIPSPWMYVFGRWLQPLLAAAWLVAIGAVLGVAAGLAALLLLWIGMRLRLPFCERLLENTLASPVPAAVVTLVITGSVWMGLTAVLAMTQGPLPPPRRT